MGRFFVDDPLPARAAAGDTQIRIGEARSRVGADAHTRTAATARGTNEEQPWRPACAAMTSDHPNADELRAKVFEDREHPGNWCVEKMDEDGGYECTVIFAGPNARKRAIDYARHRFGEFNEIELEPYAD